MRSVITITLIISLLLGCTNENDNWQNDDLLVLEGYLYSNEPVTKIHLSKTISFESEDTIFQNVEDATVFIEWNSQSYQLQHTDSGRYASADSNLKIIEGDKYKLLINYNNRIITSETTVPAKPVNIKLSKTKINAGGDFRPGRPGEGGEFEDTNRIEISWDNPDNDYFYVLVENIEENPEDIETGFGGFGGGGGRPNFRFLSMPFITDRYMIQSFMSVQQYGRHRARIFRVNLEYANLYENRQQDSRTLTEPITNVKNGLGIFTAFSYAEVYFTVVKVE